MNPSLLATPDLTSAAGAERDIRRWTLVGVIIIAATLVIAVLWSTLAPIASAVIAPGLVKVDSSRKKVQHLEGGIVKEILVRDGDRVKAGQVLARLDRTRADASHGVLRAGFEAAMAQQARLVAERDGKGSVAFPEELLARRDDPKVAELMASQTTLFRARSQSLHGQLDILNKQIDMLRRGIEGLAGQQRSKEEQIKSLRNEIEGYSALYAQGMVEKNRIRGIERDIARLEGELAEHVADIAKSRTSISEKELEKLQIRKDFQEKVGEELRQVQAEINDSSERLGAAEHVLEQTELKSPVDGTVVDSRIHTAGGVVGPGEVLLEVVPINDRLIIEAKVRPEDLDRLRLGLPAGIKLAAFDQRTTPELNGELTYVSADIMEDPKLGASYFLIRVEVPEKELARLGGRRIQPGMPAEVYVRTGERSFLGYLLDPLLASFRKAWREE